MSGWLKRDGLKMVRCIIALAVFLLSASCDLFDGDGTALTEAQDNVASVSAGYAHTVALKSDGTVWAWGSNYWGQLGDNTSGDGIRRTTPVQVKGLGGNGTLTGVVSVSAGAAHTVALKSDGTVWAWGNNEYGLLGDNTSGSGVVRPAPVQVKGEGGTGTLTGVVAVSAGYFHTVALKSDGTVWAWGSDAMGQIGDNTSGSDIYRPAPVQVKGEGGTGTLTGVVAVSAGYLHTVALQSDGTVWTWGNNEYGQLGDNTAGADFLRIAPVQVKGVGGTGTLTGVASVSAGFYHSVALKSNGTVWAWGNNGGGQLGDNTSGSGIYRPAPVQVKGAGGTGTLAGVASVSSGWMHTLARKTDGAVWAWGSNSRGQLGDNTSGSGILQPAPVQMKGLGGTGFLTGVASVSGGAEHTVALKSDGTVWACGWNQEGQLGDDETTDRPAPVRTVESGGGPFLIADP